MDGAAVLSVPGHAGVLRTPARHRLPLAPIYWLTGNAVLVYNVALIGSFALAGIGMYLLARDLTGRRDAAILAALAFMWCPNRAPQ